MVEPTILVMMLVSSPSTRPVPISGPDVVMLVTHQQPDIKKAKALERWANGQDIAKLQSAEGKPRWMVLLILGHPSSIERRANGIEVWDYPWVAACRVWFKNGVCTGTFYTAGY
jgi:hypothetical protein